MKSQPAFMYVLIFCISAVVRPKPPPLVSTPEDSTSQKELVTFEPIDVPINPFIFGPPRVPAK